jgi:alkyl hydroperoxide reductase subunit AhpC
MKIPILADLTRQIAMDYGVLSLADGCAFRGTFIIDPMQKVRVAMVSSMF